MVSRLYFASRTFIADSYIYIDDGVHLKKEGYELMGDTIADSLIEIIKGQEPQGMPDCMHLLPGQPN